jgi:hypothetical protein
MYTTRMYVCTLHVCMYVHYTYVCTLHVCMYTTCMYVCTLHVCMYVHYMYVCMYTTCMYVCMYVHYMYVCMYTTRMYVHYMYVCTLHVCMYTTCMYVCMYTTCMYVCMYVHYMYVFTVELTRGTWNMTKPYSKETDQLPTQLHIQHCHGNLERSDGCLRRSLHLTAHAIFSFGVNCLHTRPTAIQKKLNRKQMVTHLKPRKTQ